MSSYSDDHIPSAWEAIHVKFPTPEYIIRVAIFNVAHNVQKPFFNIMPQDAQDFLQTSMVAAFSFARVVLWSSPELQQVHGATRLRVHFPLASLVRELSHSPTKEFGKENIHVAHVRFYQSSLFRFDF